MQFLVFILAYPALWLVSRVPFRLLYVLSDGFYVLLYRIVGYRKKTVRHNLKIALPHLSEAERIQTEKKFYRHLCDMFLETVKTMAMSEAEMKAHFNVLNPDLYREMQRKGRNVMVYGAHYGSYEWITSLNYFTVHNGYAVYKRIRNAHFDKLLRNIRSRFHATMITTKETVPTIMKNNAAGVTAAYGLVSDQSPKASSIQHWTQFLGIQTPVHIGAEMLAKRYDMIVLNLKVEKVRRGYYEATFEVLAENPREVPNFQITDAYMHRLEKQILNAPEFYLWTHKRWKHRKPNGVTA